MDELISSILSTAAITSAAGAMVSFFVARRSERAALQQAAARLERLQALQTDAAALKLRVVQFEGLSLEERAERIGELKTYLAQVEKETADVLDASKQD